MTCELTPIERDTLLLLIERRKDELSEHMRAARELGPAGAAHALGIFRAEIDRLVSAEAALGA